MALPKILKDFTCFVDGEGYVGKVDELEPPKLTIKTEEHRAGGMDAPVEMDMGMEKLEAGVTFAEYSPEHFGRLGLVDGSELPLTFRGAMGDGDNVQDIIMQMRGGYKELDAGTWKSGDKGTLKASISLKYYKVTVAGKEVIEIDIINMVRKINGKDQLAGIRTALGL